MLNLAVVVLLVGQPVAHTPISNSDPESVALPQGAVARIGSPAFRHPDSREFLGTSADGKRIYTADTIRYTGSPPNLFVWERDTGRLLAKYPLCAPEEEVSHVGLGADGLRVVMLFYDTEREVMAKVIDPDTGRTIRSGKPWPQPLKERAFRHHGIAYSNETSGYSRDGSWFYRITNTVNITNTFTGEDIVIGKNELHKLGYPRFSDDGMLLYLVSRENTTRVYTLPQGLLLAEVMEPEEFPESKDRAVSYRRAFVAGATPDQKSLAVWMLRKHGWTLELHDTSAKRWRVLLDKQSSAGQVHFTPDGKSVALCISPNTLGLPVPPEAWVEWEVRDCATGKLIASIPSVPEAQTGFSADGTIFYTLASGVLVPWNPTTGEPKACAPSPLGSVTHFRFTPDGKLVGLAAGFIYSWDPLTGRELTRVRLPKGLHWDEGLAFGPGASRLNFFTVDGELASCELPTGTRKQFRLPDDPWDRSQTKWWSIPDGRFIRERDKRLVVWEPATGKKLGETTISAVDQWRQQIGAVCVSSDGNLVAVGRELTPRTIVWGRGRRRRAEEPRSIITVQKLGWHNSPSALIDRTFGPLFGIDPTIKPISFETRNTVTALAFSPNGRYLVVLGVWSFRDNWRGELTVLDTVTGRVHGAFGL
ncbi:MAG: WD40 repeat domain-containing protein, partial [Planctomycetia bacterium]|nr:WD40 repeat domain-containing protein [Planctomycetia bacterium]